MREYWDDWQGELMTICEWCESPYPRYSPYPWPGMCPARYLSKHYYDELDELIGLS